MKSIIITGASRGIGEAIALECTSSYDYVAICCKHNADRLKEVQNKIISKGCKCRIFVGDVSDYDFTCEMINSVISEAGHIDALVNNVGISQINLFTDTRPEDWKQIIDVNLTSVYNTCHAAVPHMIHEKKGRIINISSVWGLCGASCEVAYSTTKSAIIGFSKALAKELAPSHIAVNSIAFGAIDTHMNNHLSPEERVLLEDEIPYGRMASCKEAACCVLKALEMPDYYTGDVLKFDGAWI